MKDNVKHRITIHNDPMEFPEYLRNSVPEERPLRRSVHVGEAIRTRTLGTSNSKLLLHGVFDEVDSEDFGQTPEEKSKAKAEEKTAE